MEQILKSLEDPELRALLEMEVKSDAEEQAAFEKRLKEKISVPVMETGQRRPVKSNRQSPAVRQAVRNSLGRNR